MELARSSTTPSGSMGNGESVTRSWRAPAGLRPRLSDSRGDGVAPAATGSYLQVVGGGVRVVVRGGDEVAQRLAGELAPAEQQVEVHHEALAAEAPAQHVVDGAEHAHEALPEPGGLHAAAAGRLDPLVGLDGEIRGAGLGNAHQRIS